MQPTIIIKIVLAAIFMLSVIAKLTGKTKSTFKNAGYSLILMYAIAIAEIIFTIGLFTKYELFAAIGLLGVISGAILTLIRQKASKAHYILPLITFILLFVLIAFQFQK